MKDTNLQELEKLLNDYSSQNDFEVSEVRNGGKNTTVNWYFI
ncbi:hypothetical protein [Lactobacillus iners]|jgi:hypothetical protein|nr:hypothetical protein [Lactobacillus iners]MCT7751143.1 hypothetical protein [Lactobacillus iners]